MRHADGDASFLSSWWADVMVIRGSLSQASVLLLPSGLELSLPQASSKPLPPPASTGVEGAVSGVFSI